MLHICFQAAVNASRVHSSGHCECSTSHPHGETKWKPLPDQLADAYEFHSSHLTLPAPPSFHPPPIPSLSSHSSPFRHPSRSPHLSHTDSSTTQSNSQHSAVGVGLGSEVPVERERLLRLGLLLGRFLAEAGWRPSALCVLRSTTALAERLLPASYVRSSRLDSAADIDELSAYAARVAFEASVEYALLVSEISVHFSSVPSRRELCNIDNDFKLLLVCYTERTLECRTVDSRYREQ